VQGQGQGPSLQGPGQGQGLDLQDRHKDKDLTHKDEDKDNDFTYSYLLQVAAKPTVTIKQQWTQSESSQHVTKTQSICYAVCKNGLNENHYTK